MHFLENAAAYQLLSAAMDEHFRPLLDFLVGTGARFGEAAGLLVAGCPADREPPEAIGIADMPDFPSGYLAQLASPFRWKRIPRIDIAEG